MAKPLTDAAPRERLSAEERRRTLVEAAAALVVESGEGALRIPDVAARAGVTRQIVYRHFDNRYSLIIAILERYRSAMTAEIGRRLLDSKLTRWEDTLREVLEATCDVLEEQGPAAWHLLSLGSPDPQVEEAASAIQDEMLGLWLDTVSHVIGVPKDEALGLCHLTLGAVRGGLGLWLKGNLGRKAALELTMRGTVAMIRDAAR